MTRHGVVLPIPDDPRIATLIANWNAGNFAAFQWPRSVWLEGMEQLLQTLVPGRSSRDYNVTARSLAPFPLAEHDWL
jgi:hypothetical protein